MVQAVQFENAEMERSRNSPAEGRDATKDDAVGGEGKIPLVACLPGNRDLQTGTKFGDC